MMKSRLKLEICIPVLMVTSLIIYGCEQSFEPINQDNQYNYTMYSVLDLSADTQWVRVMPVRNSVFKDSVPNNATVSLTRLSTGESEVLKDSLFRLSQDTYVWNFWTNTPLHQNEDYLVEAVSPEGDVTSATASIPSDFPESEIYFRENTGECYIQINGLAEYIPVVEIEYRFRLQRDILSGFYRYSISHVQAMQPGIAGGKQIVVQNDIQAIANEFNVETSQFRDVSGQLTVVSSDSNWYDVNEEAAEVPGRLSNVENGLGLVTGIVSKRQPWRPNIEEQQQFLFCPPEYAAQ